MAPRVPVIVMTGEPSFETAAAAIHTGAFDYLPKPVEKATIIACVDRAAKEKSREDEFSRLKSANDCRRNAFELQA